MAKIIGGGAAAVKFTEEQLRQAAIRVQDKQMAQLPPEEECLVILSPVYQQYMQKLITQVKRGEVKPTPVRMGWQYYARFGTVAVLLCFLLAYMTMPEVVMAGYQKLIEVIETVFEEYTRFDYTSKVANDTEFVPLTLNYLPEGLKEVKRQEYEDILKIFYMDSEKKCYFDLSQKMIRENASSTYLVDTEDAWTEVIQFKDDEIRLIHKEEDIYFIWMHDCYRISGQTTLSTKETIAILQRISFGE